VRTGLPEGFEWRTVLKLSHATTEQSRVGLFKSGGCWNLGGECGIGVALPPGDGCWEGLCPLTRKFRILQFGNLHFSAL